MKPQANVVLRGGAADGETTFWGDVGSPISWEDGGGGSLTYVYADTTETADGTSLYVYRLAR
jgi:hypothetical protein